MVGYVLFAVLRYARDIHLFERVKRTDKWTCVSPTLPPIFASACSDWENLA
jgi:glyoxylate/hydroxypyruvate reductase A